MPEMTGDIADLLNLARSGDAEAQFRYGQSLQYGLGVPMDDDQSLTWYQAAADQGFERARFSLGEICKEGRITPQDLVQAYTWYLLVADGGGELVAAARESCEEVAPYLTADQISEAQTRARDIRA
jgi:TPR repeat protein